MRSRRAVALVAALVVAALATVPIAADAQVDEPGDGFNPKLRPEAIADPNLAKVTNDLLEVRAVVTENPGVQLQSIPTSSLITYSQGRPRIEVTFSELTPAVEVAAEAAGLVVEGSFPRYRSMAGSIDATDLDQLAALDEVVHIRPNYGAVTNAGAAPNQADVSIGAAEARANVGVDGTGIEVGILSDSFNANSIGSTTGAGCASATTGTSSQGSGDLPPSVGNLAPIATSGIDEGRAMAELIHDLAPGADLTFRTAFVSEADFAAGIGELVACGADVVVDDIIYLAEPMFQDGVVAQAADAAFAAGVPYFSSAGNNGTTGVDQVYVDSNPAVDDTTFPATGNDFHDFEPGAAVDTTIPITIPAGVGLTLILQWNQPFVSNGVGPGAAVDLDLYLCNTPACTGGGLSAVIQGCSPATRSGDPLEGLTISPAATAQTFYLAVEHVCGDQANTHFRIATYAQGSGITWGTTDLGAPVFDQPQIYGHAAAAGAMAVAAVDYREIDSGGSLFGGPEIDSEPFTSLGGTLPFYFDGSGNPLGGAPVGRFKPDLAAPDGTNTTFFGSFDTEPDGWPNFYGTSAAAPHAAAVAALMLEARPTLQPSQIYERLADTALDIDAAGVDPTSGAGLIQAQVAVPPAYELTVLPTPCPLYDSTTGTGAMSGPIPANSTRTVDVTGALPADQGVGTGSCVPAEATAVLYTVTAIDPSGAGNLRLSEQGVVANGGVVNYTNNDLNNANAVAVPIGASGQADVFANASSAGVRLVAIGYYADAGTQTYTPVTPCAVADSRPNQSPAGNYVGPFGSGAAYPDIDVVGTFSASQGGGNTNCNIPASADSVVVNLVAVNAAGGTGYLSAGTGGSDPSEPITHFADLGMNNANTVVVPLSAAGTVAIDIDGVTGTPTAHIRAVVLGYLEDGVGDPYSPINPCAAFDSRPGFGGSGSFVGLRASGPGGVTTYQITGSGLAVQGGNNGDSCGVPDGASAVLINLVAVNSVEAGNFRAYASGTLPTGGVLNFAQLTPAMNNSNAVVVPLDALGRIDLFTNTSTNNGAGATHARGVVLGYYR